MERAKQKKQMLKEQDKVSNKKKKALLETIKYNQEKIDEID